MDTFEYVQRGALAFAQSVHVGRVDLARVYVDAGRPKHYVRLVGPYFKTGRWLRPP